MAWLKKHLPGILCGLVILGYTLFVVLDTFVIPRELKADIPDEELLDDGEGDPESTEVVRPPFVQTDGAYIDRNIAIKVDTYTKYFSTIYVADVKLSSAEYLKTALAHNQYGLNIKDTTSNMAEEHNAILAISGDYYGAQKAGYVLRNGKLYRAKPIGDHEDLCVDAEGNFSIINEQDIMGKDLYYAGMQQVFSFGPALVKDGEINVEREDEVYYHKTSNPRTAIGIIDRLHYVFVVSDGRVKESKGLTLYELAEFMKKLGCSIAYNLDGGGSATIVFNGEVLNQPTFDGDVISERNISDIVYIGYE